MDFVDGSDHYAAESHEPPPSLLTIVLDTHPVAWNALSKTLSLSQAVANLLVFINAHLAFNYANRVAVIASHCNKAQWLYPSPPRRVSSGPPGKGKGPARVAEEGDEDHLMDLGGDSTPAKASHADDANKYRPYRLIEDEVLTNLRNLENETRESDLRRQSSTLLAGALTLALSYSNKQTVIANEATTAPSGAAASSSRVLQSRVLLVSLSQTSTDQYIPLMNSIFAAQRLRIPIDVLSLLPADSKTTFLQQASDATSGVYLAPSSPLGMLQYLMMAYLPDQSSRNHLVLPTQTDVDFRAACFCHKRVVSIGFVCSICLSIFCEPPPDAICLTCGTHLTLNEYGAKPAVVPRKKKKRKKLGGVTGASTPARDAAGTPEL